MKRSIMWEKWEDIDPEDVINEEEIIEEEEGNFIEGLLMENYPLKVRTPLGVFEYNEPLSPSKMYDCWIGYTNFRLTDSDINVIENEVDGVEQLKYMSKYRFFLGVAKMFKFKQVRLDIEEKICKNPVHLKMKENEWSMFLGNDGTREKIVKINMTDEEYENKLKELNNKQNGSIISSKPV